MDFDEFQKRAKRTEFFKVRTDNPERELKRLYLLSGLTAQVGSIANRLKKKMRDGPDYVLLKAEISERIGYALWYLAMLANELGLSLNEITDNNAAFNERRWNQSTNPPELWDDKDFDSGFPESQQLPGRMIVHFETLGEKPKKTIVTIYPDGTPRDAGIPFGNEIDDNSYIDDHYRYHDIFHFAYLAFLSWSPVVRKLLKCKRKGEDNQDIDRIEDGARAVDTEEAATAFIYSYVSQQSFLATSDNLDTGVLTTVRTLLRGFEVKACAEKDWERAILMASAVLRDLFQNGGGWVEVDRRKRSLRYLGVGRPD